MKKYILYFLTSLSSLWILDLLFAGVRFLGPIHIIFIVGLIVTFGIFLTETLTQKIGKGSLLSFFFIGVLVNFFVVYLATFLGGFGVTEGSLNQLRLPIVADQILMLLITSAFITLIATVTKWCSENK